MLFMQNMQCFSIKATDIVRFTDLPLFLHVLSTYFYQSGKILSN